jgi:hypothetical protein
MYSSTMVAWASLLLAVATPIALFACRSWIIARITKGVQHEFDVKLEKFRATLKTSEEQLKSGLREKEAEISTLRNTVLSGSANRQTLLDKRRFEAVEKIWTAVNDFAPLKSLYQMTTDLNYDALARRVGEAKIQQFLSTIDTTVQNQENLTSVARDERPFVPELTWAFFSAYSTLLTFNLIRFKTLKLGIENPQEFLNTEHVKNILKAALPHRAQFIDEFDAGAYYHLLEEIETNLLSELRKILEGKETDQNSLKQAKDILSAVKAGVEAQASTIGS